MEEFNLFFTTDVTHLKKNNTIDPATLCIVDFFSNKIIFSIRHKSRSLNKGTETEQNRIITQVIQYKCVIYKVIHI